MAGSSASRPTCACLLLKSLVGIKNEGNEKGVGHLLVMFVSCLVLMCMFYCAVLFTVSDINECAIGADTCAAGYRCENTEGSYVCRRSLSCGTGYTLVEATQTCVGQSSALCYTGNFTVLGI